MIEEETPPEEEDEQESPLAEKLRARILANGPISLHDYMDACLSDPEHGYYRAREPFGLGGDFITAPDICQAFGELIGLWCVHVWAELGSPANVRLVELGPGRGALMSDALRAASLVPPFLEAVDVHMVETSPALRKAQAERIEGEAEDHGRKIPKLHWHDSLDDVPHGPTLLIGNEFLDALPIRQLVFHDGCWRERHIGLDEAQTGFIYELDPQPFTELSLLPPVGASARQGDIIELRPAQGAVIASMKTRAREHAFSGLLIDYGHTGPAFGDTFQAVRDHQHVDPLQTPGLADLTAHVDFSEVARQAGELGLETIGPVTQRDFLLSLGIRERAGQLMESMENIHSAHGFMTGLQRLIDPEQMGHLFKVVAISGKGQPQAPGFEVLGADDNGDRETA